MCIAQREKRFSYSKQIQRRGKSGNNTDADLIHTMDLKSESANIINFDQRHLTTEPPQILIDAN